MGRRSINTTKSGKYMNPTDQARKEARKKELKKNKKQRQMVRAAVLKGKDPAQLLDEMEKIDEMEYNVMQPSPLNEKVLKEKRKKLKETFDRVMRLYHNDDPELWSELKRKEADYERRRNKKVQYYESVRHAQTVQIDDIPLPQMTDQPPQPQVPALFPPGMAPPVAPGRVTTNLPPNFPAPPIFNSAVAPPAIDSSKPSEQPKQHEASKGEKKSFEPPGCPSGPPPSLTDMPELDSDYESENDSEDSEPPAKHSRLSRRSNDSRSSSSQSASSDESEVDVPKPTSVQQRILAIAGQKYDDFMKELENVHKKKDLDKDKEKEKKRSSDEERRGDQSSESSDEEGEENGRKEEEKAPAAKTAPPAAPPMQGVVALEPKPPMPAMNPMQPPHMMKLPNPPPPPMGMPPAMMFRPPPMRPGLQSLGIRMPPGMAGGPPRMRMPPGPPPGMPPGRLMHHGQHKNLPSSMPPHMNAPGAGLQPAKDTKGMTTITAKPQIRNLSADVTRFVPTTLRVKRDDKKVQKPKSFMTEYSRQQTEQTAKAKGTTKDDAYMQFMREMQGLL